MATTPPLVGRTVEHKIGDLWVPVRITGQNSGSIVAVPVNDPLPDGTPLLVTKQLHITAPFPLSPSTWRV